MGKLIISREEVVRLLNNERFDAREWYIFAQIKCEDMDCEENFAEAAEDTHVGPTEIECPNCKKMVEVNEYRYSYEGRCFKCSTDINTEVDFNSFLYFAALEGALEKYQEVSKKLENEQPSQAMRENRSTPGESLSEWRNLGGSLLEWRLNYYIDLITELVNKIAREHPNL